MPKPCSMRKSSSAHVPRKATNGRNSGRSRMDFAGQAITLTGVRRRRVKSAWWPPRSSKPLSARYAGRGVFDSLPLRQTSRTADQASDNDNDKDRDRDRGLGVGLSLDLAPLKYSTSSLWPPWLRGAAETSSHPPPDRAFVAVCAMRHATQSDSADRSGLVYRTTGRGSHARPVQT